MPLLIISVVALDGLREARADMNKADEKDAYF